jgi:subtilisin
VVVCIAAGNEAANTNGTIPAGFDLGIVVSAYNARNGNDHGFADFSNYGDAVDIAAPGVGITSTWPGGDYTALSGTSMATPHVAGAVAAWFAENGSGSVASIRSAVISTGENGMRGQGGNHPEPLLDLEALVP